MMEDGGWKRSLSRGFLRADSKSHQECPRFRSSAAGVVKPPKATQSHPKATPKLPQSHILGIDSGVQSHLKGTPRPPTRQPIGNLEPHQSHTNATLKPPQG